MAPASSLATEARGTILKVYDEERLEAGVPDKLKKQLEKTPGLLYAEVRLENGKKLLLPFKAPAEEIFSTYGNAAMLEGRAIIIIFNSLDIESGRLVLERSSKASQNINKSSSLLDIGSIL